MNRIKRIAKFLKEKKARKEKHNTKSVKDVHNAITEDHDLLFNVKKEEK